MIKCGQEKRDVFVSDCSSRSEQFIQSFCKTTFTTFASKNFERKNNKKKSNRTPSHEGYRRLVWHATPSFCHKFRKRFFPFHFSQSLHVLHTQIKQLDKMLSQQVFHHVNKYFQSNLPDTIKTAIAYEMLILNSSV